MRKIKSRMKTMKRIKTTIGIMSRNERLTASS